MREYNAYLDGQEINKKEKLLIINPNTLKEAGTVSALLPIDIDNAYKNARIAQPLWANLPLLKRIEYINKFKDQLILNRIEIANIVLEETAKSYNESLNEVDRTIELIDYTIEESKRLNPLSMTGEGMGVENKFGIFRRVPKGIICCISPFNYPVNLSLAKIIPALLVGNCVVFKPATQGSLVGCYFGFLAKKCQWPKSIFQVVTGKGKEIGDVITSNKEIDMISFTGSVNVGNQLKNNCQTSDMVLELGGKDPALVLDDFDLKKYADDIIAGAFGFSGQRCTAVKRVIVSNKIADKLLPLLKKSVEKLSVGSPIDNCNITPLIDLKSAEYVKSLIDDSLLKKGVLICGNKIKENLVYPTIIDNVTDNMKLYWEEPFGPVLPIIRIDNEEKMIECANASEYGLQASVFCQNISKAIKVSKQLLCGTVNINSRPQRGPDCFPFLGIKNSGQGVQGVRESLLSMTRYQGIVINY